MSTTTDEAPPESPPTPATVLLHDIAEEAPLRDPVRRRRILIGVTGFVIALALIVGLLRVVGVVGGESQEEKDAAAFEKVQERILPQLRELLTTRETFFAAERQYLPAMRQANSAVTTYNRRVARHTRPSVPRLTAQVTALRQVAREMSALRTTLAEVKPTVGVTSDAHDYLLGAVRALGSDAARNAAALQSARPHRPIRLVAVSDDNALTSIKRMNKSLLFVLYAVRLPVSDFDLPGGTDKHKDDHSTAM